MINKVLKIKTYVLIGYGDMRDEFCEKKEFTIYVDLSMLRIALKYSNQEEALKNWFTDFKHHIDKNMTEIMLNSEFIKDEVLNLK